MEDYQKGLAEEMGLLGRGAKKVGWLGNWTNWENGTIGRGGVRTPSIGPPVHMDHIVHIVHASTG